MLLGYDSHGSPTFCRRAGDDLESAFSDDQLLLGNGHLRHMPGSGAMTANYILLNAHNVEVTSPVMLSSFPPVSC